MIQMRFTFPVVKFHCILLNSHRDADDTVKRQTPKTVVRDFSICLGLTMYTVNPPIFVPNLAVTVNNPKQTANHP